MVHKAFITVPSALMHASGSHMRSCWKAIGVKTCRSFSFGDYAVP